MNPYIELLRPSVCFMTVLGLIVGGIVTGTFSFSYVFAVALISAFLICGSGDVINDYLDHKIDKISMPHRPIPSGRATRKNAFNLFVIAGVIGIILSYFVGPYFFAIAAVNFVISTAYAYKLKRIIFLKNVSVAWLAASSFLAAGFVGGVAINGALLLLVVISFLAALSREMLKDVRDVAGDRSAKITTVPLALGEKPARIIAMIFLYAACVLLALPFYYGFFSAYYWIGAVPAIALCLYASSLKIRKSEKIVKIATYLVFLGFLLGSL